MKRCFVAMNIADSTRVELAGVGRVLRELPRSAARRVRPVKADNLHVTLKFLGDVPDEQIAEVVTTLTTIAAETSCTPTLVTGLGAFPSIKRPRVVFADLSRGRDALTRLCVNIGDALESLGFARERRAPHPHVTLARIEGTKSRGPLSEWLAEAPAREYGPVNDGSIILFESQLTPQGATYNPLATIPLRDT